MSNLSNKQLIAFKIGARARKMLGEDCIIEGYELLYTAIAEAREAKDDELLDHLQREFVRFEKQVEIAE